MILRKWFILQQNRDFCFFFQRSLACTTTSSDDLRDDPHFLLIA